MFQSSIAPKDDRNFDFQDLLESPQVSILDRPEGRPQPAGRFLTIAQRKVSILDRPEGRPQL